ncbi:unnamed protein product [Arctogadus glacialis]
MAQARHFTTLQQLYRKTKQNRDDVAQLLDLEFEGRRRILDNNSNYVEELRERWLEFKSREQAINLLTVLPALFPSNVAVPKKMTSASEALIHVLLPTEDPETFLNRRPLTTPLLLVDENQDAFLCLGAEAIPLPKRLWFAKILQ